jgi:hypothetical protein
VQNISQLNKPIKLHKHKLSNSIQYGRGNLGNQAKGWNAGIFKIIDLLDKPLYQLRKDSYNI